MSSTNRQLFQDLISRTRLAAALPPVSESATGLDSAVVDTHGTSSGGGGVCQILRLVLREVPPVMSA